MKTEELENCLRSKLKGGLFGHGVGDALGVPVEFKSRDWLTKNPVSDYLGFMVWNQPPGTFSDDSSMMYCTVDSLCGEYSIADIASKFVRWYKEGYWGAHDKVFDIGGTTRRSLERLSQGESPFISGEFFVENNGNGSLMRILPLIFYTIGVKKVENRYNVVKDVSSITHGHFRAIFSCFIFVEFGRQLLVEKDKFKAYSNMKTIVREFAKQEEFNPEEVFLFEKILENNIWEYKENQMSSLGYVLDSLESSLWCFMTTESYEKSVLKAVNLGGDTDTTAAITGGLSGLYYGYESIPNRWVEGLSKTKEIQELGVQFEKKITQLIAKE